MIRESLSNLKSLGREFDLFERRQPKEYLSFLLAKELYPPLPLSPQGLVWGYSLLEVAEELAYHELNCVCIREGQVLRLLEMALRLENRSGHFSLFEQERLYLFIKKHQLLAELVGIMPLIETTSAQAWLERIACFNCFSQPLKLLLTAGLIDFKTAQRYADLPPQVFELFLENQKRLSFSERRLALQYLWEIGKRDQLSPTAILALAQATLTRAAGLRHLWEQRFPKLSGLKAQLACLTAELKASGIEVSPPPNFEGEELAFSFGASSPSSFRRKLKALKSFEVKVDQLFKLL